MLVGINDSGVDDTHPDLAPNFDAKDSVNCVNNGVPDTTPGAWRPTTSSHGTHVAGTVAAARNGVGIVGVAPGVRIASVKVVNDDGFIYPEYSICGIVWAAEHHMDVTNHSYFIDPFEFWCKDNGDQGAVQEAVRRAYDWATDRGVTVRRGGRQLELRPGQQDHRQRQPERHHSGHPADQQRLPGHADRAARA